MSIFKMTAVSAAAFGLAMAGHAAMADTISHFTMKATLSDKAKVSGALYIDTTIGTVTSADLVVGAPDANTQVNIVGQGENYFGAGLYGIGVRNSASTEDLNLDFNSINIVDYKGGTLFGNLYNLITNTPGAGSSAFKLTADSIKNFYATGTLVDGAKISGYVTIDRTLGTITRTALSFGGPDYTTEVYLEGGGPNFEGTSLFGEVTRNAPMNEDFDFVFGTNSLVGYNGGSVPAGNLFNLTTNSAGPSISSMSFGEAIPSGGVFRSAAVPEPVTWSMMLIGFAGLGGAMRSRRRTALAA